MDASDNRSLPRTAESPSLALTVLTAIVYIVGFATVSAWFALLVLGQPAQAPAPRGIAACNVCGVVERVGEFERASLKITGEQSEGFVVLLAALGGSLKNAAAPGRIYETAVLHDDGSVRIVRDSSAPRWKRGDRVRVVKGRIENAMGVQAVSQTEKTLNPGLPATQVQ
jgi:hypothetical protein